MGSYDELRGEREAAVERALLEGLTEERSIQLYAIKAEYDRRNLPDMAPWSARDVVSNLIAQEYFRLFGKYKP